jgi:hypothetical protein
VEATEPIEEPATRRLVGGAGAEQLFRSRIMLERYEPIVALHRIIADPDKPTCGPRIARLREMRRDRRRIANLLPVHPRGENFTDPAMPETATWRAEARVQGLANECVAKRDRGAVRELFDDPGRYRSLDQLKQRFFIDPGNFAPQFQIDLMAEYCCDCQEAFGFSAERGDLGSEDLLHDRGDTQFLEIAELHIAVARLCSP